MSTTDLKGIVHSDPEIMGGTPVFVGTRVPVENLFDHLKGGDSIEVFLDGFPSVKREQVLAVLELAQHEVLAPLEVDDLQLEPPLSIAQTEELRKVRTGKPLDEILGRLGIR